MADEKRYPYMLCFSREGFSRYIAHLDWIRIVQLALDRSRLPLYYTEGFSPKAKLKYSPPLPVGCASLCELVLIYLVENLSTDTVKASLENSMPDGMPLTHAHFMHPSPPKNPFQTINGALYEMSFPGGLAIEYREKVAGMGSKDIEKILNDEEFMENGMKLNIVARLEERRTFHPVKFAMALKNDLALPHIPQPRKMAFLNIDEKGARKLFQFD